MDQYTPEFAQDHAPARRKRRRMLVAMLLASSLATVGAGAMSLAVFTDGKASTGAWTTGTIILGVTPSAAFSASNIMPGDTGTQVIAVQNTGTGALRYAVTTAISGDTKGLAAQMTLAITTGPVVSGACTGTSLYSGSLTAAALGNPAQGADAGDRSVAAGATDNLCFQWTFPKASGNAFQGAATNASFTFAAEQTANN
jgi:hypothetical protein